MRLAQHAAILAKRRRRTQTGRRARQQLRQLSTRRTLASESRAAAGAQSLSPSTWPRWVDSDLTTILLLLHGGRNRTPGSIRSTVSLSRSVGATQRGTITMFVTDSDALNAKDYYFLLPWPSIDSIALSLSKKQTRRTKESPDAAGPRGSLRFTKLAPSSFFANALGQWRSVTPCL